jgi:hypothetical protein
LNNIIEKFSSIHSLKSNLEREIEDIQEKIQEYSNLLGEKIRSNEESSSDDPDFLALKAKLDGTPDDKKSVDTQVVNDATDESNKTKVEKIKEVKKVVEKKKKSKKGVSDKWYNLNEILVYNGIGVKGELELYFKAVDELKSKLENHQRTLATLNNVIEKGLKEDMGCVAFRGTDGLLEISFIKSTGFRKNFSLKSIYSGAAIPVENIIKIGV